MNGGLITLFLNQRFKLKCIKIICIINLYNLGFQPRSFYVSQGFKRIKTISGETSTISAELNQAIQNLAQLMKSRQPIMNQSGRETIAQKASNASLKQERLSKNLGRLWRG
ncbi:hypothetical protein A7K50_04730 [Dehalobacter sp. MCB1]|nr:hypothetical protein A7K50_04730 [Dehalobacter sp. MCB1]TCX55318.1 hypothetical protein C1I38_03490 [Dehalobacter sp. 12DCB1]